MKFVVCLALMSWASLSTAAELEDLPMYKECLMECFRCVKIYGKQIYNGKLCAENCALTSGASIDNKCYPPAKRANNKTQLAAQCIHLCQDGCPSEASACVIMCILSNSKVVEC
ncbi:hypothetical protein Bpfe_013645 [Biomphalaria pfeifferi]|uniref:Uncharacterized protein n=1 Tax=Biomphalaria pfeifferi TaxID=112525 RepID=A0AAD8BMW1_BIOPF|nr:hypothetical protein Bpfe_013645 [Biomphalaria pfeifferi]